MQLSDGEKIIIALLADIHKAQDIKSELDVDFIMDSISSGHLWSLKWQYSGLLGERDARSCGRPDM